MVKGFESTEKTTLNAFNDDDQMMTLVNREFKKMIRFEFVMTAK